ncbi:MAG: 2-oxoglutarate dehydrogenase E1 component [Chitinophagaceae bacterium]|nr:2-oxoglutarate dehydrogenase E1 component [Chitinophagaceae bacterium]
MNNYSYISNADPVVIEQMYQEFKKNPGSVDISWQKFFQGYEFCLVSGEREKNTNSLEGIESISEKEIQVRNLIYAYRSRGHLRSKTNPIRERRDRKPALDISYFGLSDADMDTEFRVGAEIGIGKASLRKIIENLSYIYERSIGFEYMHIRTPEIQKWFINKIEQGLPSFTLSLEEKTRIVKKLNQAVAFENFLHTKYVGQKRFSLEGGETTIPALDALIYKLSQLGVKEIMIGMAHRGRLNVLTNIMSKTYEQIFNEFEGTIPDQTMGDGDVKYHMGYSSQIMTDNGYVDIKLAPNPSHLEAVDPIVLGFIRAKADKVYHNDYTKCIPILIHGDAALAGQGIIYEIIQMSKLEGYTTGGTIHFVINNQVGFTTDFDDARSSIYCTDIAKTIDAPILHVNGDDPEAVVFCSYLASEFRQTFQQDVFIDMVCYRKHGHNESDEPKFTQPTLYTLISKHPNPREIYKKYLIEKGVLETDIVTKMEEEFKNLLQDRLNMVKEHTLPYKYSEMEQEWKNMRRSTPQDFESSPQTNISLETIQKVGKALTTIPNNFVPIKQIEKVLRDRNTMFFEEKKLNWASAELLAYGSLLLENKTVRITGQDVQRGTFSHRHAVIRDQEKNNSYNMLNFIEKGQEEFKIFNSPLSEFGVLGFEFGYAMANPNALVIWEAQFGDFANGAQVIIDQFIIPSYTKWQRMNGIVLLLPHGYEGQGPEHSSGRLERFLQMSSGNNIFVCNITTPANFFHFLRRQLVYPFRMPSVVMSPKSLFRNPLATSPISHFTDGKFQEILCEDNPNPKNVKKILFCTGKIYYDLLEEKEKEKKEDIVIIRIEQLHPFPKNQILNKINIYNKAKLYWVQEEPENMGAYFYIMRLLKEQTIQAISRKSAASPATGYYKLHNKEQLEIIKQSIS